MSDPAVVQWPHRADAPCTALPEAWVEPEGTPFDPAPVPGEPHGWLAAQPAPAYRDIQKVAPDSAIVLAVRRGTLR